MLSDGLTRSGKLEQYQPTIISSVRYISDIDGAISLENFGIKLLEFAYHAAYLSTPIT